MKNNFFKIIVIFLLLLINSCTYVVYEPLTLNQISRLYVRMPLEELLELRGEPTSKKTETRGELSSTGPWQALILCYRLKGGGYDRFIFQMGRDNIILNNFELNCKQYILCNCD
jgi:hypothetical protein